MDDEAADRIARNEALFRNVNEAIRRGRWPGDRDPVAFRCECARIGCAQLMVLPLEDYERIRANSRQFFLAPGHELPEAETVVERNDGYWVVEKRGEAAAVAEGLDPRA